MPTYPISPTEMVAGKPLTSWLLKRLRDNWAEDMCDPPGSQTIKMRPSSYRVMKAYRGLATPVVIDDSSYPGQLNLVRIMTTAWVTPTTNQVQTVLGFAYVGGKLRVSRVQSLVASAGTISGILYTDGWTELTVGGAWTNLYSWTSGANNKALEGRALSSGTTISIELRHTGSVGVSSSTFVYGFIAQIQNSTT